jgi:O-methyltransferase
MPAKTVRWRDREIPVESIVPDNPEIANRYGFFERAARFLNFNGIPGDYAEFGCASAKTFRMAYDQLVIDQQLSATLWAFDGFEGLPASDDPRDVHPKWTTGNFPTPQDLFELIVQSHGIPASAYRIVAGRYSDTIGPDAATGREFPSDIALAYVDCDLYSSARDVVYFLSSRLKHGMIVAFDDYFCDSPTAIAGERLAFDEFVASQTRWHFVPYGEIGWHGRAFVVEDTNLRRLLGGG